MRATEKYQTFLKYFLIIVLATIVLIAGIFAWGFYNYQHGYVIVIKKPSSPFPEYVDLTNDMDTYPSLKKGEKLNGMLRFNLTAYELIELEKVGSHIKMGKTFTKYIHYTSQLELGN